MNFDPVRWGILSTADIGMRKVIPAMQSSPLCSIDAIASRDADRATGAAAELGIPKAYDSYEALLADPDIEAVYIPLPNNLHREWAVAAAEAGKHILCEKPIAMTSEEAREMVPAADRAGVLFMEAFMYRQHPMWVGVREMVDNGVVGAIRHVATTFSYFNDDPGNIRNIAAAGGGALYDIGCYAVSAARFIFGSEPTGVSGDVRRDPEMGVDILTTALLEFDAGTSVFVCSTRMEPSQRVEILGTSGRIVVEIPFNIPPDRPTRVLEISGGEPPVSPGVTIHDFEAADPYTVQGEKFSAAVRGEGPLPIATDDGVANLEVIEAIFSGR